MASNGTATREGRGIAHAKCHDGHGQRRGQEKLRGFTLIEVLIALAIVAVALGAVLRAIGVLSSNVEFARSRLLAIWSADNVLGGIAIARQWPAPGRTTFPCPEGTYQFVCRQTVTQLESPRVRQIEVRVFAYAASGDVLADAVTVIHNEALR